MPVSCHSCKTVDRADIVLARDGFVPMKHILLNLMVFFGNCFVFACSILELPKWISLSLRSTKWTDKFDEYLIRYRLYLRCCTKFAVIACDLIPYPLSKLPPTNPKAYIIGYPATSAAFLFTFPPGNLSAIPSAQWVTSAPPQTVATQRSNYSSLTHRVFDGDLARLPGYHTPNTLHSWKDPRRVL